MDKPSRCFPPNTPVGFHIRGPCKAGWAPRKAQGLAAYGQASLCLAAHGCTWWLHEIGAALCRGADLCFCSCSHIFRQWAEIMFNFYSPVNWRASGGRTPKSWGHSREKHSLKAPEPPQPSSYLAEQGITPQHLQLITFIPVDFVCTEVLRSDTLMFREGND